MSDLDKKRITALIRNIKENQTIITGTEKLDFFDIENNILKVNNAKIIKEEKNGKI